MYAVVEISGKQQLVKEGEIIKVDRLPYKEGDNFELTNVLAVGEGESTILEHRMWKVLQSNFPYLKIKKIKKLLFSRKKEEKATK